MENTLEACSRGRNNNLDFIRFIAAVMVIWYHSHVLAMKEIPLDLVGVLSKNQLNMGGVAVSTFFLYGGFLLAKSVSRVQNFKAYFIARIKRIFPPLIVVVAICTFIIGPVMTNISVGSYFTNIQTYKYLLNGILVLQHNLPGVFTSNVYGAAVNGSLWTLPVEFICYIMCYIAYKFGFLNHKGIVKSLPLAVCGSIGIIYISNYVPILFQALRPILLFYIGMLFFVYRDKIVLKFSIFFGCLLGLIISSLVGFLYYGMFLFFPYIMVYLGFGVKYKWTSFAKYGDFSYAIYLWGFPVQQIVIDQFGGSMPYGLNFAISMPIVLLLAVATYYVVEKRFQK